MALSIYHFSLGVRQNQFSKMLFGKKELLKIGLSNHVNQELILFLYNKVKKQSFVIVP